MSLISSGWPILHAAFTAVGDGIIPGQWGNWAQARAYWCPGLALPVRRDEITSLVRPGEDNTLEYRATYGSTGAPRGGDIALTSYVVWY